MIRLLALALACCAAGCGSEREAKETPAPPPSAPEAPPPMEPIGEEPPAPEAPPRPRITITRGEVRRAAWLEGGFPCRAISTTRYRTCRFEEVDGRVRLRFPLNSVTCDDVRFGDDGDPSALNGCHSSWLSLPADNPLAKAGGAREAWSASTRGWRWRSDGESYCCPGMWIMAPDDLPPREEPPAE